MKTPLLLSMFLLSAIGLQAQTFNECAAEFRSKWQKIQLDAVTQKRNDKKVDSLFRTLESAFESCIIGNELPQFNLTTLSGNLVTNESLSGKVVYLNIWTIHCGACWQEIPVLNKLDTVYNGNEDFVFISLLLDKEQELSEFLEGHKKRIGALTNRNIEIDFDLIANEAPFGNKDLSKILPFPTHLFIDKQGKISKKLTGSFFDSQKQETYLRTAIDELLAK
ncbi:TlpA disulfide reductase family protein [Chryseolinea sp. T2]|uniref:TlpA family protein disulfide reductase n=1 Tax=Chryseolinea sp. T2 TaxID=3129255 RepID=UPI003077FC71